MYNIKDKIRKLNEDKLKKSIDYHERMVDIYYNINLQTPELFSKDSYNESNRILDLLYLERKRRNSEDQIIGRKVRILKGFYKDDIGIIIDEIDNSYFKIKMENHGDEEEYFEGEFEYIKK